MSDDIINIEERRKGCGVPQETFEQKLRRAIARGMPMRPLSPQHEAALFVWRAIAVAESDSDRAADFLEMAAQRLRKGGDDNDPPPAGA